MGEQQSEEDRSAVDDATCVAMIIATSGEGVELLIAPETFQSVGDGLIDL
ncbi:MAG: hypothetical protein ACYCSF_05355 [Acidimicrobiales bacterium]